MKNNINNLTTEELLKQLSETTKTVDHLPLSDELRFIQVFNLKPGSNRVTAGALYKLYTRWSKTPTTRSKFISEMSNFFERTGATSKLTYLLNIDPIRVSQLTESHRPKQDLTKITGYKTHFELFLKKYDLKKGNFQIKSTVLHDLYDKWRYEIRREAPLSASTFNEFAKLYFDYKRDHPIYYFGVDHSILNILTDEQKLQCLSTKGQRNAIKKEKNKKI